MYLERAAREAHSSFNPTLLHNMPVATRAFRVPLGLRVVLRHERFSVEQRPFCADRFGDEGSAQNCGCSVQGEHRNRYILQDAKPPNLIIKHRDMIKFGGQ